MARRGGKWRRYYDWRELPMRMRVTRRVPTGCGEVVASLFCSALDEQCTSAEVGLPGRRMSTLSRTTCNTAWVRVSSGCLKRAVASAISASSMHLSVCPDADRWWTLMIFASNRTGSGVGGRFRSAAAAKRAAADYIRGFRR